MTEKILFLHIGATKTGSSMLQNFFEFNYIQLEKSGFAYENRLNIKSQFEVSSGNGIQLYDALTLISSTEDEIDNLVSSYFGQYDKAICSSEYLATLSVSEWERLIESLKRLAVNCRIIIYIRNPVSYLLSIYDQYIKRHGEWRSFEEWLIGDPWEHFKILQNLLSTFPKEVIYVRHFDSAKKALIRDFLDVLGIDAAFEIDANLIDCIVNRSLTNKERQVMYAVNKIHGEAYSMELSDLLIYSSPSVESEQIVCKKKTMALLQEKFNDQVEWVNKTFFNGLNIVSILSAKPIEKLQREQPKTNNSDNNVDELALDWAIKKMVVIKNEAEINILNTLQNMLVNPIVNPLLPADFDPLAYLIINKDLFFAGVNPQLHYLTYGIIEGRVYKFT